MSNASRSASPSLLRRALLPVGVSLATVGVVLALTYEPGMGRATLEALRWPWLLAALAAALARLLFGGLWVRLLSDRRLAWWAGARAYLAREFFSAITPSAVGGAPLASAAIAKASVLNAGQAVSILTFVMVFDHVWYVVVAFALLLTTGWVDLVPAVGGYGIGLLAAYSVGLAAWTALLAYATVVHTHWLGRAIGAVTRLPGLRRFHDRLQDVMDRLEEQAARFRGRSARFYAASFGFAALTNLSRYALIVAVLWSFVPDVPGLLAAARAGTLWLFALAMPTPGGAGGVEGLFLLFFAPFLPQALKAPAILLWRLFDYALILALGAASTAATVQRAVQKKLDQVDA